VCFTGHSVICTSSADISQHKHSSNSQQTRAYPTQYIRMAWQHQSYPRGLSLTAAGAVCTSLPCSLHITCTLSQMMLRIADQGKLKTSVVVAATSRPNWQIQTNSFMGTWHPSPAAATHQKAPTTRRHSKVHKTCTIHKHGFIAVARAHQFYYNHVVNGSMIGCNSLAPLPQCSQTHSPMLMIRAQRSSNTHDDLAGCGEFQGSTSRTGSAKMSNDGGRCMSSEGRQPAANQTRSKNTQLCTVRHHQNMKFNITTQIRTLP